MERRIECPAGCGGFLEYITTKPKVTRFRCDNKLCKRGWMKFNEDIQQKQLSGKKEEEKKKEH